MPLDGITVYAKWVKKQYRVFLHPNVPTSDTSFDMGGQGTSFRLNINEKIAGGNEVNATRDDFDLVGWYTDEACTKPFNFDAYVMNDDTVKNPYDKSRPTELDLYGNPTDTINKDADRYWIDRSLDLYAKWRSKIVGAPGINVQYDAVSGKGKFADGKTLHTDPLTYYLDLAEATGQAASIPDNDQQQFMYWVVQKWDEATNSYVDTDEVVYPGDTFEVKKANARVQDIEPDQATPGVTKKYTVQLRAEYEPKDAPTPTHIDWYPNYEENHSLHCDNKLQINQAVDIIDPPTREGFKFLGWARVPETESKPHTISENVKQGTVLDLSEDDVFLFYDEESGKYKLKDGTVVKKVAADEVTPYHDMYAVWQSNTIKFTKEVAVEGSLELNDVNHTIYIALTKDGKDEYVKNQYGGILFKEIHIVNGVPQPETVSFSNLEDGSYNVWELENPYANPPTRLSVSDVFPIAGTGKNFAVKRISGNNNATVSGGSVELTSLTNTYAKEEETPITFEANKVWIDRQANVISEQDMPGNATATFSLYRVINGQTEDTPVASVTMDGQADQGSENYREDEPWHALFENLPRFDDNGVRITYKLKETAATPDGYYPWKLKSQNNDAYGPNDYLEHSGGTIYNRKLTMTVQLQKHFDFQPNDGESAETYAAFAVDDQTKKKLRFTVDLPTGSQNVSLDKFHEYSGHGSTTFLYEIEDVPYYTGLYPDEGEENCTITFKEYGEADLLKAYNYYISHIEGYQNGDTVWDVSSGNSVPTEVISTRTVSRDINANDPMVEIRIQNKYRRGSEGKIQDLQKNVIGLSTSDFNSNLDMFKGLHFAIRNSKGKYYAGAKTTPTWNPDTKRYEKINWVDSLEDAVLITPALNNYSGNASAGWSSKASLNLPALPSDTYTIIEMEAQAGGFEGNDAHINGYELSVEGTTLVVETHETSTTYSEVKDYHIEITNRYTRNSVDIYLNKTDKTTGSLLPGSQFTLTRKNSTGTYEADDSIEATKPGTVHTLTDGTIKITGLPPGDYKLTEQKAPDGYVILSKDIYFTVANGDSIITPTEGQEAYTGDDIGARTKKTDLTDDTLVIPNTPGQQLPNSGGIGTTWIYLLGFILVLGCGVTLIARRRIRPAGR